MGLFGSKKNRKKKREARRKNRAEKKAARQNRRMERKEARAQKKQDKRDFKLEKKAQRQNTRITRSDRRQVGRSNRATLRTDVRKTAYENGMDPNAWVGDAVKGVTAIGGMIAGVPMSGVPGNIGGKPGGAQGGFSLQGSAGLQGGQEGGIIQKYGMYIVGALALWFLTKKK
jgi:hypothetical protein